MWYGVQALFKSFHPEAKEDDLLWEEQVLLIEAENEGDAGKKAMEIAVRSEVNYKSVNADSVAWRFVRIDQIFPILDEKIASGTEVFSRHLRESEVEMLKRKL